MSYIGTHWIFDGHGASPDRLDDEQHVKQVFIALPEALALTRVSQPQTFRHDGEEGRSLAGVVLLAESHFSIHTFPDQGILHCDLFSCTLFDMEKARQFMIESFSVQSYREQVFTRTSVAGRGIDLTRVGS